jgi:hypothetical protein
MVYFASHIAPVIDMHKNLKECPNALCSEAPGLVSIDELMIRPITILNKKGYQTKFCCSGHDLRGKADQNGYIMFRSSYLLPSVPEGWFLDTEDYFVSTVIRSKTDDLATSIFNLNKWVDSLPEREE